jgi:hypothetical protein
MKTLSGSFHALIEKIRFLPTAKNKTDLYAVYKLYMVELNEDIKNTELALEAMKARRKRVQTDFCKAYYDKDVG